MSANTQRSFGLRLVFAFLVTASLMGALKSFPTNDARGALAWWDLKKARIDAMEGEGPRVLFTGGSATLFGLSAESFQALTSEATFNFGLHASFGQALLVEAALAEARPGDLLIWSPELAGLRGAFPALAIFSGHRRTTAPSVWEYLEHWFRTPPDLIGRWPGEAAEGSVYHIDAIGSLGDQRFNRGRVTDNLCLISEDAALDWGLIEEIFSRADARGVKLLFRFPNIADLPCNDWVMELVEKLREGLKERGIEPLNARSAMRRPVDEFHDTHYHLNQRGVAEATRTLASELKRLGHLPLRP